MNIKRLAGWAAGSVAFSTVWAAGAQLAPGPAPWYIWALGFAPQAVAAIAVVIQEANDALMSPSGRVQVEHVAPRRLTAYRQEATRPAGRRELTAP